MKFYAIQHPSFTTFFILLTYIIHVLSSKYKIMSGMLHICLYYVFSSEIFSAMKTDTCLLWYNGSLLHATNKIHYPSLCLLWPVLKHIWIACIPTATLAYNKFSVSTNGWQHGQRGGKRYHRSTGLHDTSSYRFFLSQTYKSWHAQNHT
jgi:hypothetical protein